MLWAFQHSLEPIVDCGVTVGVVSFEFIVSFYEFVTTSFGYGSELSFSTSLLIIELVDIRRSKFLL